MFELRLILEPAAVRTAAGRIDAEFLRSFSGDPGAARQSRETLKFLKANREFHIAIIKASGNERLVRILDTLLDEMDRLLHLGLFTERDTKEMRVDHNEQDQEHKAIIEALASGDGEAAEKAARKHIQTSYGLVMKAIMNGRLSIAL